MQRPRLCALDRSTPAGECDLSHSVVWWLISMFAFISCEERTKYPRWLALSRHLTNIQDNLVLSRSIVLSTTAFLVPISEYYIGQR